MRRVGERRSTYGSWRNSPTTYFDTEGEEVAGTMLDGSTPIATPTSTPTFNSLLLLRLTRPPLPRLLRPYPLLLQLTRQRPLRLRPSHVPPLTTHTPTATATASATHTATATATATHDPTATPTPTATQVQEGPSLTIALKIYREHLVTTGDRDNRHSMPTTRQSPASHSRSTTTKRV